ncbi:MAG: VOC family protein [Planctomycetes bacterium]|jgi:extradiol dioxygenase family protein|nr:VOC family protein [Planctomycetota bacterium]
MSTIPLFHYAFPVHDLAAAREFYGGLLGCAEGRSAERWVDFSLHGHQLSAHLVEQARARNASNPVDGDDVPIPHFGLILEWGAWHEFALRLRSRGARFAIEPHVRFRGLAGEQATMFLVDPSGNALEFKAFEHAGRIFAT